MTSHHPLKERAVDKWLFAFQNMHALMPKAWPPVLASPVKMNAFVPHAASWLNGSRVWQQSQHRLAKLLWKHLFICFTSQTGRTSFLQDDAAFSFRKPLNTTKVTLPHQQECLVHPLYLVLITLNLVPSMTDPSWRKETSPHPRPDDKMPYWLAVQDINR